MSRTDAPYVISVAAADKVYLLGDYNGDILLFSDDDGEDLGSFILETTITAEDPDTNLPKLLNNLHPRRHKVNKDEEIRVMAPAGQPNNTMLVQSNVTEEVLISFIECTGNTARSWRDKGASIVVAAVNTLVQYTVPELEKVLESKIILPEGKEKH